MATGRWLSGGVVVLVGLGVAACPGQEKTAEDNGFVGPHTKAPPLSITDPMNRGQQAALVAFARDSLEFADPTYDSTHLYHGQWDRALVDTLGDTAIVEPEVNIHRTDDSELVRGRIQMKIVVLVGRPGRTSQQIYEALKVPPGVSYAWVDSLKMDSPTHGAARVVVIPADTSLEATSRTVEVYRNPRAIWNRAVARWTPFQCWTCVKPGGWCEG
jgi:hypothetical protein